MAILGADRLRKKLSQLPAVAQEMIREAMQAGAEEIVALMRSLCPKGSGRLARSIGWTWGKAPKGSVIVAKGESPFGDATITIYAGDAEAFYARFVEFGVAAHKAGGLFEGAVIPAIAAHPFFFPAYRAKRKRVKSRITRAMNKAAKQVAAGK